MKEKILELINARDYKPLTLDGIYPLVCDRDELYIDFYEAISSLEEEGEVIITQRGKLMPIAGSGYFTGCFRASQKEFGFVTPSEGEHADYFVPPGKTAGAIDGDKVLCRLIEHDSEKSDVAEVTKIISHSLKTVIGTLRTLSVRGKKGRTLYTLEPDSKKYSFTVICTPAEGIVPKVGNKVEVELTKYPKKDVCAKGKIIRDFGKATSREANYTAILHENGIKTAFEKEALAEADREAEDIPDTADQRQDLCDRMIFTIDGEDAKDLDDAVSVERLADGYLLGVHIADVSHYVRQGSAIDREAYERGTSVYFTDQVVPMLPKALSNGICSLNPGVPRRTLSAFVYIDNRGNITGCDVKKTLICSKVRGVYSQVNDIFEKGEESAYYEKYSVLGSTLDDMRQLYEILAEKSVKRGALELETVEAKILVDENALPTDIIKRERGIAEKLIEQFMLAANEAVAGWLNDMSMPCVYRIHEEPPHDKIQKFALFAHNLGLDTSALGAKKLHPSVFSGILREAKEKELGGIVSYVLLRSLSKAKYSESPSPHFGLGIEKYCHFTSPIRRYPDLATHRIISNILVGNISPASAAYLGSYAQRSAVKSTENELKAIAAERDIEDLYKCLYMERFIGQEFDAVVSSVTGFGLFAELENSCEGMIPITTLDGYYSYDEGTYSLVCGLQSYRLGDRIKVVIDSVDLICRKIEMRIADGQQKPRLVIPKPRDHRAKLQKRKKRRR